MDDFDPQTYLDSLGKAKDSEIDLYTAAIALAARTHPERHLDRYFNHIEKLANLVAERHTALLKADAMDDVDTRIAALKHIIHDAKFYDGDHESYDRLDNADMIEVVDRRKGLPVAIAIIYMSVAHRLGWRAEGLNFPAHFIIRMEMDSERRIVDPFHRCKILQAPDLRQLVKQHLGPSFELSADFYEPVSRRDVLIRLENNLKFRLIEMEAYEEALAVVDQMGLFAPDEPRLYLDRGILLAKLDQRHAAITALETYRDSGLTQQEKAEIDAFVWELRSSLN